MSIARELLDLIADVGRAAAREREEHERWQRDSERERTARDAEERARIEATVNAEVAWSWVAGPEADALRAAMHEHGVEGLQLGVWSLLRGERCAIGFGTVTIDIVADDVALHVHVVRPGYVGHRSRRVHSAAELVALVPSLALAALADDVRAGQVLVNVTAARP